MIESRRLLAAAHLHDSCLRLFAFFCTSVLGLPPSWVNAIDLGKGMGVVDYSQVLCGFCFCISFSFPVSACYDVLGYSLYSPFSYHFHFLSCRLEFKITCTCSNVLCVIVYCVCVCTLFPSFVNLMMH